MFTDCRYWYAGSGLPVTFGRLAEVPHSRNFGFGQGLSCGILPNRCYVLGGLSALNLI